jgi:hypothetical protein
VRKANLKRLILGVSLALLGLTTLGGCVVYDPYYYPRYGYGSYYGPYYGGYGYYGYGTTRHFRDHWD